MMRSSSSFLILPFFILLTACGDFVPATGDNGNPPGFDDPIGGPRLTDPVQPGPGQPSNPTGCARAAQVNYGFSRTQAIELCGGNGNLETANCARYANYYAKFSYELSVELCTNGGTTVTAEQCAQRVNRELRLSQILSVKLCKNGGNKATADCAAEATRSNGYSAEQAVVLCEKIR